MLLGRRLLPLLINPCIHSNCHLGSLPWERRRKRCIRISRQGYYSPEGCHVSAALNPDTFASLLEVMQTGRFPDWLSVRVKGLSYGWEPDGSGKEWDIGQTRHAPVLEVAFRLPLAAISKQTAEPAEAQEEQTVSFPATSADLKALESSLITATKELHRQSLASVKLLVVLVSVLVLPFYSSESVSFTHARCHYDAQPLHRADSRRQACAYRSCRTLGGRRGGWISGVVVNRSQAVGRESIYATSRQEILDQKRCQFQIGLERSAALAIGAVLGRTSR